MLCENCNEYEANVRYTQIVNGVKKEMRLCDKCAKKLGIGDMDFHLELPIDFSNFFGELLNEYEDNNFMPTIAMPKTLTCDKCGLSFDEFVESGKFGCAHCYDVFEERINPILKRLHGNNRYIGRKVENQDLNNKIEEPKEKKEESKIEQLRDELKQMIKEEKYEEAAKIRDEIKKLENIDRGNK